MNSKKFLKWGGAILVLLAVLGFFIPALQQTGSSFYLDSAENWVHLILGLVALAAAAWIMDGQLQKWLVVLVGVIALYFGVWGFVVAGNAAPNYMGVANLETADNLLHLVVGVWALWAAFGDKS